MLLIELCFIIFVIVDQTQSNVILVEEEDSNIPAYLDYEDNGYRNEEEPKLDDSLKPIKKPSRSKHAIVHYGRHIYHLDKFNHKNHGHGVLRSEPSNNYISLDYSNSNEIFGKQEAPWFRANFDDNLLQLAAQKIKKDCEKPGGQECKDNMRKFNEILRKGRQKLFPDSVEEYIKHRMPIGRLKRFKIVDSSSESKAFAMNFETPAKRKPVILANYHAKAKRPKENNRNKKYKSETSHEKNVWSSSESDENWPKNTVKKKKLTDNQRKNKKKYNPEEHFLKKLLLEDKSLSSELDWPFGSNSIEKSTNKIKGKKKKPDTERKTFVKTEMYLQGSRLVEPNAVETSENENKRRRLPQFLPKRYHWEPEDIHDLGYFWFNGPKGRFPHPTTLIS